MVSTGPSPDLVGDAEKLGVQIGDPVVGGASTGNIIGLRPGKRYGRRSSTMSPQEMNEIIDADEFDMIRDPADPQELFLEVTDTPVPGRKGEVEIDVSQAVTGEVAFNEMMDAFKNDQEKWDQIAEGLLVNGYTTFDEDPEEIYDYDNVVNGMLAAVAKASQFAAAGGAGLGMMPTVDALLKATDPADLQAEIDRITATKRPAQYTRATITEYAGKAFREKLDRGPTDDELKTVIGLVHSLQGQENVKFDLTAEIGGMAGDLDPNRAAGVEAYNAVSTVKNALGLK
tara:strand:+ start:5088 stop:5945 length:858 start_codon:yes stop_codon:yes gene_type:complete